MHNYYRVLDKHNQPLAAVAMFTGRDGHKMPGHFEDHCLGTHLLYEYNTLRITDYDDEALKASENPFATVMLAAKLALLKGKNLDEELLKRKLLIVRMLHARGIFGKPKIEAIMTFLKNYVLFQNKQTNRIFMEEVDQITGKKNTMGIIEQLAEIKAEEARVKGEKKLQRAVLAEQEKSVKAFLNNTEFSPEKIASLVGVPVSFIEKVKGTLN